MSDKLNAALNQIEKARASALAAAIDEKMYRACVLLDDSGPLQRSINRARRMLAPKASKKSKA